VKGVRGPHSASGPGAGCRHCHRCVGERVEAGRALLLLESMKMEVPLEAPAAGVRAVAAAVGDMVAEGTPLLEFEPLPAGAPPAVVPMVDPAAPRPDLLALQARRALLADARAPRRWRAAMPGGLRSARENVADLLDAGSLHEYGAFAVAAQRSRRSLDDLQRNTPADGLITATGSVNAALFGAERARVAVMAYDYTVLAGTQGVFNHAKSDRLLGLAERCAAAGAVRRRRRRAAGRRRLARHRRAGLHDLPRASRGCRAGAAVGIVAGRCFAGNAALLGCCDFIVAVEGASIGMGGPAMIEGGGLGRVDADAVGPWT
jgi:acetyl-CoA carboxylase carboxyltransferase component